MCLLLNRPHNGSMVEFKLNLCHKNNPITVLIWTFRHSFMPSLHFISVFSLYCIFSLHLSASISGFLAASFGSAATGLTNLPSIDCWLFLTALLFSYRPSYSNTWAYNHFHIRTAGLSLVRTMAPHLGRYLAMQCERFRKPVVVCNKTKQNPTRLSQMAQTWVCVGPRVLQILRERIADCQLHAVAVSCHQGTVSQTTDLWATHSGIQVVLSPEQSIQAASSQPTRSISSSTNKSEASYFLLCFTCGYWIMFRRYAITTILSETLHHNLHRNLLCKLMCPSLGMSLHIASITPAMWSALSLCPAHFWIILLLPPFLKLTGENGSTPSPTDVLVVKLQMGHTAATASVAFISYVIGSTLRLTQKYKLYLRKVEAGADGWVFFNVSQRIFELL